MAFVAGATKINFINLKASAKIDFFDASNALKELINSDKDKFERLTNSGRSFNRAYKLKAPKSSLQISQIMLHSSRYF